MSSSTELAAKVAILAEQHDRAMALIRDIATSEPKDSDSGGYGQSAAEMVLKCRVFLRLDE